MDKNTIFTRVQKCLETVPVMLIGTGATIPLGIPGMGGLSAHLISTLDDKYKRDTSWNEIKGKLDNGMGLESALTDVTLADALVNDIVEKTWELIVEADISVFNRCILNRETLPLSNLINKFYQVHPKCINIITTNYDRMVEYACDQKRIQYDTRFQGGYIRHFSTSKVGNKDVVNIFKIHGSLDLFKDASGLVCSIPGQHKTLPVGFLPEIISPGISKYKAVLTSSCRNILIESAPLINNASSFLCIGYGFNDEQIQTDIIAQIRTGKPIVVLTQAVSPTAKSLIDSNSSNYILIEENPEKKNSTRFTIDKNQYCLDGDFWTIDGLTQII